MCVRARVCVRVQCVRACVCVCVRAYRACVRAPCVDVHAHAFVRASLRVQIVLCAGAGRVCTFA